MDDLIVLSVVMNVVLFFMFIVVCFNLTKARNDVEYLEKKYRKLLDTSIEFANELKATRCKLDKIKDVFDE